MNMLKLSSLEIRGNVIEDNKTIYFIIPVSCYMYGISYNINSNFLGPIQNMQNNPLTLSHNQ